MARSPEIYAVENEYLRGHKYYVFIHKNAEEMAEYHKGWTINEEAHTRVDKKFGITLHFRKDNFELALVAHEATHAALWSLDQEAWPQKARKISLWDHPEQLPELVGNLTASIWHMLPDYQKEG